MKKLLLILLYLPMIGFGQWTNFYFSNNVLPRNGLCVEQTNDGGYIAIGQADMSKSWGGILILKTDVNGDTLWTNIYENYDLSWSGNEAIKQTNDLGYIITGSANSSSMENVLLMKIDSSGNILWTKFLQGDVGYQGVSVYQTIDTEYIVAVTAAFGIPDSTRLIKTDSQGNTLWMKTFLGRCQSIDTTSENGYIIVGEVDDDAFVTKTDSLGNEIWTQNFGGIYYDVGTSIRNTLDGGYILTVNTEQYSGGIYEETECWLIKLNLNGSQDWIKVINGGLELFIRDVEQTSDGGYILIGQNRDSVALPINIFGQSTIFLAKMDVNGNEQWRRMFDFSATHQFGNSVSQIDNGGYIMTGSAECSMLTLCSMWLIQTNSLGALTSTFNIPINSNRKLQKTVDVLGRETKPQTNIPFIEIYDDGTVEKRIVIE